MGSRELRLEDSIESDVISTIAGVRRGLLLRQTWPFRLREESAYACAMVEQRYTRTKAFCAVAATVKC